MCIKTTAFYTTALEAFLGYTGLNFLLPAAFLSGYLQQNTLQAFAKGTAKGQKITVERLKMQKAELLTGLYY